ncbi:MAG: phosphoribosylanthranilate isomerase [Pseudomonadota bacterium]
MSPWCKICGITSEADGAAVQDAGADALGLVFTSLSKRQVSIDTAAQISQSALTGNTSKVGLFVNPSVAQVTSVLQQVPLDLLQFQGDETAEFCAQFGLPYVKAIGVSPGTDFRSLAREYPDAWAIQLDAHVDGERGGTGQSFDWSMWPESFPLPLILAGGLDPDNVARAIRETSPFGVDVSGGVEALDARGEKIRGQKSHQAIRRFVSQVK